MKSSIVVVGVLVLGFLTFGCGSSTTTGPIGYTPLKPSDVEAREAGAADVGAPPAVGDADAGR